MIQNLADQTTNATATITSNMQALQTADLANYPDHFATYNPILTNTINPQAILNKFRDKVGITLEQEVKFFRLQYPLFSFVYNSTNVAEYDLHGRQLEMRQFTIEKVFTRYHSW